jgi:hypothetical protein
VEAQAVVVPCENPELHVSAVRGAVHPSIACDPSVLSRMGGTCSVTERLVSDVRCVNSTGSSSNLHAQRVQSGASHRLEGKFTTSSMPASSACERSQGSAILLECERNKVEVKRMHGHGVLFPDCKCSPRGTCVWENDVRAERCSAVTSKSMQSDSEKHWQQGKQFTPSVPVRPACEGHDATVSQHVCHRREEEVNQSAPCCEGVPDYKSTLRGTCAWEEDVNAESSKLAYAGCESKRERELKTTRQNTERIDSCSAASFSGRVVGSESPEVGSNVQKGESGKHTGVRLSKIHVPSNLREAQRSLQWE